jgi:hypothetical protein
MQTFPRPVLTAEEQKQSIAVSAKIARIFDMKKRQAFIFALAVENMSLLKEVNIHRATLGLEPLKVHDVDVSKIG